MVMCSGSCQTALGILNRAICNPATMPKAPHTPQMEVAEERLSPGRYDNNCRQKFRPGNRLRYVIKIFNYSCTRTIYDFRNHRRIFWDNRPTWHADTPQDPIISMAELSSVRTFPKASGLTVEPTPPPPPPLNIPTNTKWTAWISGNSTRSVRSTEAASFPINSMTFSVLMNDRNQSHSSFELPRGKNPQLTFAPLSPDRA
jgi:hypothetical protein